MNYLIKINDEDEWKQYLKIIEKFQLKSLYSIDKNPYCLLVNLSKSRIVTGDEDYYRIWKYETSILVNSISEFNSIIEKYRGLVNINKLNLL